MADPIFERRGDRFLPTGAARGPWDPDALHGGPVAMLVAGAVESSPTDEPMDVARLTLELLRPVPLAELEVSTQVERQGRRVQVVGASVSSRGGEVARARALRIRSAELGLETSPEAPPNGPDGIQRWPWAAGSESYIGQAVELRVVGGSIEEPGPATLWVRLVRPVVEGEDPSPLQRVCAAADFGNGVSAELDWNRHVFINPDLTIHLLRPPLGEWVCMAARSVIGPGHGVAESALFDMRGWIGRSLQSLYVDAR